MIDLHTERYSEMRKRIIKENEERRLPPTLMALVEAIERRNDIDWTCEEAPKELLDGLVDKSIRKSSDRNQQIKEEVFTPPTSIYSPKFIKTKQMLFPENKKIENQKLPDCSLSESDNSNIKTTKKHHKRTSCLQNSEIDKENLHPFQQSLTQFLSKKKHSLQVPPISTRASSNRKLLKSTIVSDNRNYGKKSILSSSLDREGPRAKRKELSSMRSIFPSIQTFTSKPTISTNPLFKMINNILQKPSVSTLLKTKIENEESTKSCFALSKKRASRLREESAGRGTTETSVSSLSKFAKCVQTNKQKDFVNIVKVFRT